MQKYQVFSVADMLFCASCSQRIHQHGYHVIIASALPLLPLLFSNTSTDTTDHRKLKTTKMGFAGIMDEQGAGAIHAHDDDDDTGIQKKVTISWLKHGAEIKRCE